MFREWARVKNIGGDGEGEEEGGEERDGGGDGVWEGGRERMREREHSGKLMTL